MMTTTTFFETSNINSPPTPPPQKKGFSLALLVPWETHLVCLLHVYLFHLGQRLKDPELLPTARGRERIRTVSFTTEGPLPVLLASECSQLSTVPCSKCVSNK